MALKINIYGAARDVNDLKVNVYGAAKQVKQLWQNVGGVAKLVWENWQYKTGTLVDKSKSGSYGGNNSSPYYTERVTFDKQTRIVEMSIYTKIIRSDISGRQDGRIKVYGIKNDDTEVVIADVTNQWETSTVTSDDTETSFKGVNIGFWLTDTISRNHECDFNFKITKWYEK